ncbi:MAG TPA: response regulator [Terriglobales bacterium]|nr:response regulator [Terriglobales bacterium]
MEIARTVLLVEDDPADARLVQRAFQKVNHGLKLLRLKDGDEAVSYLAGDPPFDNRLLYPMPEMVLLDIKLPRRSGLEVLEWLRRRTGPLRRLPVVMLTSSRHSVDVNRAYELGANSYLAKPDTASGLEELARSFQQYWTRFNQPPSL